MAIKLPSWLNPFHERNRNGDNLYLWNEADGWGSVKSNLNIAQNHPILTPAMLFVSKLLSQSSFGIRDVKTKKDVSEHWLLDTIYKPNYYQTKNDFFESLQFMMIAQGFSVIYAKKDIFKEIDSFYILNVDLIEWPEELKTPKLSRDAVEKYFSGKKVIYDKDGENLKIDFEDLLFFYDLPNATHKNMFESSSRLDGLHQTLVNTKDSLLAKNIILKTNGKELISGEKGGFPLGTDEKEKVEDIYNASYGLSARRKRGILTKSSLKWQSLHIALRDLGLDESVKVDGNLIYTALHIPKDILSLEAKKTTYNNFKESMVSYIQNEMQSSIDAICSVLNSLLEPGLEIYGSFDHLPVMQHWLIERYKGIEQKGKALYALRIAGLPDDIALIECGFDKTIKLSEIKTNQNENTNGTGNSGGEEE